MALDDPIVWVLIIAALIFLFGGSKIPGLAKALGDARREFDRASRGEPPGAGAAQAASVVPVSAVPAAAVAPPPVESSTVPNDPLLQAAQREGIDTRGKTREQVASELAWKLNKK